MTTVVLIFQICIVLLILFFKKYIEKKAEHMATKEDIADITNKVESIKLEYSKSLSEYNINLENFRKVIEIRISAADQIAEIRRQLWSLLAFNEGIETSIEAKIRSFTSYMNAYLPFFVDCKVELQNYSEELKRIEGNTSYTGKDIQPTFKAMEMLLAKILSYK